MLAVAVAVKIAEACWLKAPMDLKDAALAKHLYSVAKGTEAEALAWEQIPYYQLS